jgi:RNA polymerase sigma factor (sigma-70 family)
MTDSQQLLAEYARTSSDAAFRELVTRYVDLVYSTALRLVGGDTHRAEDVTQTVFVDLANKARTLPEDVRLGGWLHRDTCLVAGHTMRGERRRQSRERQAVEMNVLQNNSEADFSGAAPMLDEAINELGEEDRTAILLRFFEQQDFRSVGQALGSKEDAARMRVTRALEKLQYFLKRRGVTTSAASLGVVLTANAVQAAPLGLAVTISTAAALAGTTIATNATAATIKTIAMTTLQKTLIVATVAAAALTAGTVTYFMQQREANPLRSENQNPVPPQPTSEQKAILSKTKANNEEFERLRLLRLESEVGKPQTQTNRQLDTPRAKAAQLSATPEISPAVGTRIQTPRLAELITLPLLIYAADNQGRFPTSFDAASPYLQKAAQTASLRGETELTEAAKQFEIVFHGSRDALTNAGSVILIRERLPRQKPDGRWEKTYGFADGHAEVWITPDGNYESREKLRPTMADPCTNARVNTIIFRKEP